MIGRGMPPLSAKKEGFMRTFHCKCRCSCGAHIEWDGSWEMLGAGDEMEEIRIQEGSRSYDLILGTAAYSCGRFLCIPSLGVGIEVESCSAPEHIKYCLSEKLNYRDAVTISQALADYFKRPAATT